MSKKRCGDLAGFTYKVTSELVGKYAVTMVVRDSPFDIAVTHAALLKQEETKKVKWPDLQADGQPDGTFYGGRRVDFKGLDKLSYSDKFTKQAFELKLYQGKQVKKSSGSPIKIEGYPDQGNEKKEVGFAVKSTWAADQIPQVNPATGATTWVPVPYDPSDPGHVAAAVGMNVGHYYIAFVDGLVILKVKLNLKPDNPKINVQKLLKYVKRSVESYWNDPGRGLGQWVYHRTKCKRLKKCDCAIVSQSKDGASWRQALGCCKFSVRLIVESGNDHEVEVVSLTKTQKQQRLQSQKTKQFEWSTPGTRANTKKFYFPENRFGTYAHEVGHMLGLPDQYTGGAESAEAGMFPIDENSVMGSRKGGGSVPRQYIEVDNLVFGWVKQHVDPDLEPVG